MRRVAFVLLAALIGCGDDDGATPTDAPVDRDEIPIDAPDCGLSSADFGDLGEPTGVLAGMQGDAVNGLASLLIPLTAADPPDRLAFEYWSTQTHTIQPGTFELTGAQTSSQTCDVCVLIYARWTLMQPPPLEYAYWVTGGTANVTVIDPQPGGAIEVELTNLTFQHVRLGQGVFEPRNDGCVTAVDRVVFRGNFEGGSAVQ